MRPLRRVELLERDSSHAAFPEEPVSAIFERHAANEFAGFPPEVAEQWADVCRLREQLRAAKPEVPVWYQPHLPDGERRHRWHGWNNHELNPAVDALLDAFVRAVELSEARAKAEHSRQQCKQSV